MTDKENLVSIQNRINRIAATIYPVPEHSSAMFYVAMDDLSWAIKTLKTFKNQVEVMTKQIEVLNIENHQLAEKVK